MRTHGLNTRVRPDDENQRPQTQGAGSCTLRPLTCNRMPSLKYHIVCVHGAWQVAANLGPDSA
eukprot:10228584-Alexandrium_andersonii.AAC.1